ncbi:MAG TPA: M14 family zinc carboxypeptidase, partial [Tenuifilaceae bacterium]|nr:M14 family zinc carboxypeptidase [Tenuifilaceae bacterium]
MKYLHITQLIVFTCLCTTLHAQHPERYFRFVEPSKETINTKITRIISIDRVKADTVWAYANDEEFARFSDLGYKVELLTPPSLLPGKVINMATTIGQMASWDRYPTYPVYRELMKKFEQDYPQLCKLDSIGTTVEGRKLYVLKISGNVQANEPEPEVFYTSTIHGDEVTGFVLMLRLADYLLSQYGSNSRITNLLNGTAIYINPNANPDGTYYSGDSTVYGARRDNQNNVDLNRNFPDPRAGDHPNGNSWQPETQAMMNFANEHHFILSANFHGGAEVANYPWDTWESAENTHADNSWYYTISRAYADSVHAHGPAGYFTDENNGVTNGGDWYVITGGRQDYMNYWHHCREITLEISSTKLLSSDELPAYWGYNRESLIGYLEHALTGFYGTVTNTDGQPLDATITIPCHDRDSSHVVTNPEHGSYYRMIAPGSYEVLYQSDGYISQIHTVSVPSYSSRIMKDVVLEPAQQVNLSGLATDSLTGNPIEGAKVELVGSSYTPVYTNAQGIYVFSAIYE